MVATSWGVITRPAFAALGLAGFSTICANPGAESRRRAPNRPLSLCVRPCNMAPIPLFLHDTVLVDRDAALAVDEEQTVADDADDVGEMGQRDLAEENAVGIEDLETEGVRC